MTVEMEAAIICREYGWTWQEFQSQPMPFIDAVWSMLQEEARASKREQEKTKRRSR